MNKKQLQWLGAMAGMLLACVASGAAMSAGNTGETATPSLPSEPAIEKAPETAATADHSPVDGSRHYDLTLEYLGRAPTHLRGIDGSFDTPFNIRTDEVVTAAKLHLRYAYSPSFITDLSHINVFVNEELVRTILVPKESAGKNLETDVDIPVWLIGTYNHLRIQLIGHYTLQCEDPVHTSLWADISNQSSLDLTVTPLALAKDLALLPQPFFDRRDTHPLDLPFVFAAPPDNTVLEAAAMVSSWFGSLSGYRGASFPVSQTGQIPANGNAVLFVVGGPLPAGLDTQQPAGPGLAVTANPRDPVGKLLVVMGRNSEELKLAAKALALGARTLSGQFAAITSVEDVHPREPYDAPRWLRGDRAVKFGELAEPAVFSVPGYTPDLVRVNVRIPPDLFGWRDKGVPIHLKYRYTPRPTLDKSTLTLSVDGNFVRSYPLLSREELEHFFGSLAKMLLNDSTVPAETDLKVPLYRFGADSQLQYQFSYDYVKQGECRDVIIDNARSEIDPDSTVDISAYDHYLAMPDLAAFAGTGFPFTRLADLSETAVVMPNKATEADLAGFLAVIAHMSQSTGYPVVGLSVVDAADGASLKNRDLLVIDSAGRQPLTQQWAKYMPAVATGRDRRFALSDLPSRIFGWFSPDPRERVADRFANVNFSTNGSSGAFIGFESPVSSGRSVVMVSSSSDQAWKLVLAALAHEKLEGQMRGSLAVVSGNEITSLVEEHQYYVGHLGFLKWLRWYLSGHPLLLFLLALMAIALLAVLAYLLLRERARRRLAGS